ncbi:unnamed protein product [Darwinula stevensoni]|uniref:SKA complex subunit 1 n=1 Tax=Darwinula stevensoni TaxID=69355 RepID=A0A7R8X851_9CRUS|nr:unnamed protein product [Darwinula stevensoni]CAG0888440.1 unnamed protein product [Darwinula stevensoni]
MKGVHEDNAELFARIGKEICARQNCTVKSGVNQMTESDIAISATLKDMLGGLEKMHNDLREKWQEYQKKANDVEASGSCQFMEKAAKNVSSSSCLKATKETSAPVGVPDYQSNGQDHAQNENAAGPKRKRLRHPYKFIDPVSEEEYEKVNKCLFGRLSLSVVQAAADSFNMSLKSKYELINKPKGTVKGPDALVRERMNQLQELNKEVILKMENRITLAELSLGLAQTLVVALVVAKQEPRTVLLKKHKSKGRDDDTERTVLKFTIRDSEVDVVNVSCWGPKSMVHDLNDLFHIGDVVEIFNAEIQLRSAFDNRDQYEPFTTNPFHLNLVEGHTTLGCYSGDWSPFIPLFRLPTRPPSEFLPLFDLVRKVESSHAPYVTNMLAVVRKIGDVKDFTGSMVVYVSDATVKWDSYRNSVTAATSSRTVVTFNPECREAQQLEGFISTGALKLTTNDEERTLPDAISGITTIYGNVAEVKKELESGLEVSGILYALISHFDLDGPVSLVLYKCSLCGNINRSGDEDCSNQECGATLDTFHPFYSFQMSLTDPSGTLNNCRLTPSVAESITGVKVEGFLLMEESQRTQMKWDYLMERFKIYFQARPSQKASFPAPSVRILALEPVTWDEALNVIK